MKPLLTALRLQLPFLVAGFLSFVFSVWLYFVADEKEAGIFVGLWVPSIHSLGTLLLSPDSQAGTGTRRLHSSPRLGSGRIMNEILFIIGVFVFFISVYGAVMVGGHLLEELEHDQSAPNRISTDTRDTETATVTAST